MTHGDRLDDASGGRGSTFSRSFDADEGPSEAVVTAVAAITGKPPVELPSLYDAIDPDALDSLFDCRGGADDSVTRRVTFTYADHEICVRGDGEVRIVAPPVPGRV